jgi:hypothetical protein
MFEPRAVATYSFLPVMWHDSSSRRLIILSSSTPSTKSEYSSSPKSPRDSPSTVGTDLVDPIILEGNEVEWDFVFDNDLQRSQSSVSSTSLFERAAYDPSFPAFDFGGSSPGLWPFSVPQALEYSTEAAATQFFFRNFVHLPQQSGSNRGFLELIIPSYTKASSDSPLHLATHAVALSALGNYPGNWRLKLDAGRAYGKTLNSVNEAMKDPSLATSDQTILAILLLSLYEVWCIKQKLLDEHSLRMAICFYRLRIFWV